MRTVALALALAFVGPAASADQQAPGPTSGGSGASGLTAERIRSSVEEHIQEAARESQGLYRVRDPRDGKTLELEFVAVSLVSAGDLWRIHDPDRRVDAGTFLACVRFHPVGRPEENIYDVDMLVEPRDGAFAVTDVRVHKEKRLVKGKWIWEELPMAPSGAAAQSP